MGRLRVVLYLVVLSAIVGGVTAWPAAAATGGAAVPGKLVLADAVCIDGRSWSCRQGQQLILKGSGMDGIKAVLFMGRSGHGDDRLARPLRATPDRAVVVVPRGARTGQVRVRSVVSRKAAVAPRRLRIAPPAAAPTPEVELPDPTGDGVFPIRGKHDMGQTATNGFGGGRGHQGQDLFAACGTPLVAVRESIVQFAGEQSRAGNYLVLQDATGRSYVYMHMRSRALVDKGARVSEGQAVGFVGETGRASGCHLHFELWTAPGWYTGGHAIDALTQLKRWEAGDRGHR